MSDIKAGDNFIEFARKTSPFTDNTAVIEVKFADLVVRNREL
jgi:hypothetical protein